MATYSEQIQAAFNQAKSQGIKDDQAYAKIKASLGDNATALSVLENVYRSVNDARVGEEQTAARNAADMVRDARNNNRDVNALLNGVDVNSALYKALVGYGATPAGSTSSSSNATTNQPEKTYNYNGQVKTQSEMNAIAVASSPADRVFIDRNFGTAGATASSVQQSQTNSSQIPSNGNAPDLSKPHGSGDVWNGTAWVLPGTNGATSTSPSVDDALRAASNGTPLTGTLTEAQKAQNLDKGGIDYSKIDAAGQEFKAGYDAYIQAQKDVYNIGTDRQNQQYGYQRQDLTTQNSRQNADYARFTGQEIQDTARTLALNNTDFARSLTNASRAYGQRGILGAGVQKASLNEGVGQFAESQGYFKTLSQRRLDSAATTNANQNTDFNTNLGRLSTSEQQYGQDRAAGSAAMVAGLKQQGNTLYGQNQVNAVQLAQQKADQDALDRLYGRTPTSRPNLLKNIY